MVRLRLQRMGRRHRPFFRLAAMDQRTRRNGRTIENLGWYDPIAKDESKQIKLNEERVKHWLSVGAQPTDTVRDILARHNLIDQAVWEADRAEERKRLEAKTAAAAASSGDDEG